LKDAYFLKINNFSSDGNFQLKRIINLFMQKLTNDKLGLSFGGFFIIESSFILTVCDKLYFCFFILYLNRFY